MSAFTYFMKDQIDLIILIILSGIIYFAVLYLIKGYTLDDLNDLKKSIFNRYYEKGTPSNN